jgi:hypothetical protein
LANAHNGETILNVYSDPIAAPRLSWTAVVTDLPYPKRRQSRAPVPVNGCSSQSLERTL